MLPNLMYHFNACVFMFLRTDPLKSCHGVWGVLAICTPAAKASDSANLGSPAKGVYRPVARYVTSDLEFSP